MIMVGESPPYGNVAGMVNIILTGQKILKIHPIHFIKNQIEKKP